MIIIKGGVTTAKGFLANGVKAGIKKSKRLDLGLLYSEVPAAAAGAFTTNAFQASPIKVSSAHLKNHTHQAVIANSGNANCANGKVGDIDSLLMTEYAAKALGLNTREVLVASTGIIGRVLPIDKIKNRMHVLVGGLSEKEGRLFSEAILTTDTCKKEFAVKVKLGDSVATIGGACKGVGMIYPNIKTERHATMLSFITTDVYITKAMLESALDAAVEASFNMVSVDGDMSTNDACFILANGLAGNKKIAAKDVYYYKFAEALKFLTIELAKMLARDGEGATKFVQTEVEGAKNEYDAKAVARKISTSNLLKCCIYGEDPNWGRVIAACGASGVGFDPNKVDLYLQNIRVLSNGSCVKDYDKKRLRRLFKERDISLKINLKSGSHSAASWTCDMTKEYVEINSEYST